MELRYVDIRPGKVLQVVDNYGTVKASCAGVFSDVDDPELLPPIIPFFKLSSTSYCMPHEGDDVNVWINTQNPQELYYTFQGMVKKNNESELEYGNNDVEILSRHVHEGGDSALVYDEDAGWKMTDKEAGVNVSEDVIELHNTNTITINDEGISLAGKKANHLEPAVLGDELEGVLKDIVNLLKAVAGASGGSPHTLGIKTAIESNIDSISSRIANIKSKTVKLT